MSYSATKQLRNANRCQLNSASLADKLVSSKCTNPTVANKFGVISINCFAGVLLNFEDSLPIYFERFVISGPNAVQVSSTYRGQRTGSIWSSNRNVVVPVVSAMAAGEQGGAN